MVSFKWLCLFASPRPLLLPSLLPLTLCLWCVAVCLLCACHTFLFMVCCCLSVSCDALCSFGGKASRSMPVAAAAALAATCLQWPVAYSLSRAEDFASNGGRCAGRLEYEVGYRPDGKVVAVQAQVGCGAVCVWGGSFAKGRGCLGGGGVCFLKGGGCFGCGTRERGRRGRGARVAICECAMQQVLNPWGKHGRPTYGTDTTCVCAACLVCVCATGGVPCGCVP